MVHPILIRSANQKLSAVLAPFVAIDGTMCKHCGVKDIFCPTPDLRLFIMGNTAACKDLQVLDFPACARIVVRDRQRSLRLPKAYHVSRLRV